MLYFETIVKESSINGKGIFSVEFIPKGSLVWKFLPHSNNLDIEIPNEEMEEFKNKNYDVYKKIKHYGFLFKREEKLWWGITFDGSEFMNHSDNPNLKVDIFKLELTANQDILTNTELTYNYKEGDLDWYHKLK